MYKLGKLPARPNAIKLKLVDYLGSLPSPPTKYGHENLVVSWGDLGNLTIGDCVLAGAGHETMLWNAEASKTVNITTQNAISDYSLSPDITLTTPIPTKVQTCKWPLLTVKRLV